jgi:hypothetical protein
MLDFLSACDQIRVDVSKKRYFEKPPSRVWYVVWDCLFAWEKIKRKRKALSTSAMFNINYAHAYTRTHSTYHMMLFSLDCLVFYDKFKRKSILDHKRKKKL